MKYLAYILLFVPFIARGQFTVANGEYTQSSMDSGYYGAFTANINLNAIGSGTSGLFYRVTGTGTTFNFVSTTLHGGEAIDVSGNVWVHGGGDQGQLGVGDLSGRTPLTKILIDSRGLTFAGITIIQGSYIQIGGNGAEGNYYVKHGTSSDSVFYSGWRIYGMGGDGFTGSDTLMAPTLMFGLTAGKRIVQMCAGVVAAMRLNDGTVWSWGGNGLSAYLGRTVTGSNYATPIQITYPGSDSITQIVGGAAPGILALGKTGRLYGNSNYSGYMGNTGNPAYSTPQDLTDSVESYIFNGTTRTSIMTIGANSLGFYAIANDSTLFYWGDLSMGGGGNGVASNLASPGGTSTPWFIDPSGILLKPQTHPVQVGHKHNFYRLSTGVNFAFNEFATTTDGLYTVGGRNKGGVIPNGVIECSGDGGDLSSYYPDSWDVIWCTKVDPYHLSVIQQSCQGCLTGAVTAHCHSCGVTTSDSAIISGGTSQSTTSSAINMDGSPSTSTSGTVTTYVWSSADGVIDCPGCKIANWSGLSVGTHNISLTVIDNGFHTSTQTATITVTNPTSGGYIHGHKGAKKVFYNKS